MSWIQDLKSQSKMLLFDTHIAYKNLNFAKVCVLTRKPWKSEWNSKIHKYIKWKSWVQQLNSISKILLFDNHIAYKNLNFWIFCHKSVYWHENLQNSNFWVYKVTWMSLKNFWLCWTRWWYPFLPPKFNLIKILFFRNQAPSSL